MLPNKDRTRAKSIAAIKKGILKRLPCEKCGVSESECHHLDYADHLNVQWLCRKHHSEWHKENGPLIGVSTNLMVRVNVETKELLAERAKETKKSVPKLIQFLVENSANLPLTKYEQPLLTARDLQGL